MSLKRRSFLAAIFGAPVAAKAIERIISEGITPVKPTPQAPYEQVKPFKWDPTAYACSGYVWLSGCPSPFTISG